MTRTTMTRLLLAAFLAGGLFALLPASAMAAPITVSVNAEKKVRVLGKVEVSGKVTPALPGVAVRVNVFASGRKLFHKDLTTDATGSFEMPIGVRACCKYRVEAVNAGDSARDGFSVKVPKLKPGKKGQLVKLFNSLLHKEGYHIGAVKRFTSKTKRAIHAFRKVNRMPRNERYSKKIFRKLLQGKGGFNLKHPGGGKHVEVSLARQVMVLAEKGKPRHTFHISSGAGGTPTVTGKFHFYLKQPGYNSKSMYYSVYFIGGYATHGYDPVPDYPASHGCVRNPIPDSKFIYNWIDLGDPIWVY